MLLIFEEIDKSGKTTLANRLSMELDLPYLKLNNIDIVENEKIKDNISVATHSQLETFTQLYERGLVKDAILDRFHASEFVYSNLFERNYNLGYLKQIESRLAQFNDVILIRTKCNNVTLKKRFLDGEKLISTSSIKKIQSLYELFYKDITKLPFIEIDTSTNDIELAYTQLKIALYNRGIFKEHMRARRATHEETMMEMAKTISKRSPDLHRQVGAILTEDGFIVGAGYNGPPSGLAHDETCIRREAGYKSGERLDLNRAIHAEQNAIMQSGIRTRSNGKLELFTTDEPCIHCMKMLIQIGVKRIYYIYPYPHELASKMANEANIEMIKWER